MDEVQRGAPIEERQLVHLIQRAQQEFDPQAFDGLYCLYVDRIYRFLLARLGDNESAEEITSQVFIRLIEKIEQYRIAPQDNVAIFSAWLYRMTHNRMVDVLRAQRHYQTVKIEDAENIADASSSLEAIHTKVDFEKILQKVQLLNEQQRQVIILRFVEGLNVAETAKVMEKSEGAIKALQHRSLETLRRYLQNEDW
jgi:RNA polymerase sigma-70 factor, ECF subfamily